MNKRILVASSLVFAMAVSGLLLAQDKPVPARHLYVDLREGEFAAQVVVVQKMVVDDFQCIPNPGNPPTGLVRVYCDTSTGNLTCLTSAGASCTSAPIAAASTTSYFMTQIRTKNLIAAYLFTPTETCGGLVDYSGNGLAAIGTSDTAPTMTALTGGCAGSANGGIKLPPSLNGVRTIQILAKVNWTGSPACPSYPFLAISDGSGAASNAQGLSIGDCTGLSYRTTFQALPTIGAWRNNNAGATQYTQGMAFLNGTAIVTVEYGCGSGAPTCSNDGTFDTIWVNRTKSPSYQNASQLQTAGYQTTGNWRLLGAPSGSGASVTTYANATEYIALFYSDIPLDSEIVNNVTAIQAYAGQRNIPLGLGNTDTSDMMLCDGDSRGAGSGLTSGQTLCNNLTLFTPANGNSWVNSGHGWNIASPGGLAFYLSQAVPISTAAFINTTNTTPARQVSNFWACRNDFAAAATPAQCMGYYSLYVKNLKSIVPGLKAIAYTEISSSSNGSTCNLDTTVAQWNTLLRQYWRQMGYDGLMDTGAIVGLAPNGTNCTGGNYQSDFIHPNSTGEALIYGPAQRAVNALFGNTDFSMATTYSSTASLADQDVYFIIGGAAASQTYTLPPCAGYTGQSRFGMMLNTANSATLAGNGSDTINGAASVTIAAAVAGNHQKFRVDNILTSASAGGCSWQLSTQ